MTIVRETISNSIVSFLLIATILSRILPYNIEMNKLKLIDPNLYFIPKNVKH